MQQRTGLGKSEGSFMKGNMVNKRNFLSLDQKINLTKNLYKESMVITDLTQLSDVKKILWLLADVLIVPISGQR